MTLQETVHFSLNATDSVADKEWQSLTSNPRGFGRVRMGPDHRVFVLTMFHQLHCIHRLQTRLVNRHDPASSIHHFEHCLHYLRQTFLCDASYTLEEGDFMTKDYANDRVGSDVVCRDWTGVYREMDTQTDAWEAWNAKWN
jgi:hypothetical protein